MIKIRDLLNDGRFLSRAEFQEKYGLKVNFLKYFGLLSAIPSEWKNSLLNSPHIPSNKAVKDTLSPSNVTAKMAREYFVLKVLKSPNIELELVGKKLSPKAIYQLPFKVTIENKLRCFQYKIIHGILPTNKRLFKMGLKTSPRCDRCNFSNETLVHLLYECPITQSFWREIINWWNEKRSENCTLNATDILYGYKPDCTKFYALNHVLIIAKYHIFQAWLDNSSPSFEIFYLVLKEKILCESRIAFKNNTLPKFRSKWTTLCALAPQNVSL